MKEVLELGSWQGESMQWLVVRRSDKSLTLLSRYLTEVPAVFGTLPKTQDEKLSRWLSRTFLPSLRKTTQANVLEARLMTAEEARLLLEPDERCACAHGSDHTEWWHLKSTGDGYAVVSDCGDVCTRKTQWLAMARPVIEIEEESWT